MRIAVICCTRLNTIPLNIIKALSPITSYLQFKLEIEMILTKKRALKARSCIKKLGLALLLILTQFQLVHANTAVEGWNFGSPITNGTKTTWNATKEVAGKVVTGVVSIKPTPAQVSTGLKRAGALGIGLTAVQELLDGIDYVLDPANNTIQRKPTTDSSVYVGYDNFYSSHQADKNIFYANPDDACAAALKGMNAKSIIDNNYVGKVPNYIQFSCNLLTYLGSFPANVFGTRIDQEKVRLAVGSTIIDLTEKNDAKAQAFVSAVAQDLLEHDEDVKKAVVAELGKSSEETKSEDDKKKCSSGITSQYGQCWICPEEAREPVRGRVNYAKMVVEGLGQCEASMNSSQLITRYKAYSELSVARDVENACWTPPHQPHIAEARVAENVSIKCNEFLGILGK